MLSPEQYQIVGVRTSRGVRQAMLFSKSIIHAGSTSDGSSISWPEIAWPAMYQLRENVLAAGQGFAGWLLNRRPLPACMTVLNVIGNLLTDSCQVKELFLG